MVTRFADSSEGLFISNLCENMCNKVLGSMTWPTINGYLKISMLLGPRLLDPGSVVLHLFFCLFVFNSNLKDFKYVPFNDLGHN